MTIANKIPSVLYIPCSTPGYTNSISIERVLKQTINLLDSCDVPEYLVGALNENARDLEEILKRLDR